MLASFEDWTLKIQPAAQKPARVMLMLHGWTGDENSMWYFAGNLPPNYWIIAPRAPHLASPSGYSWRVRKPLDGFPPRYEDFHPAAVLLADLVDRWGIANAVDTSQLDVIGFSQGAAVTVTFALAYPHRVRKIGILAGFAPLGSDAYAVSRPLEGKRVFVTHGTEDEMVPIEFARQSMTILEQAGAQITYCEANIGHKVSKECLKALNNFFGE
jgi:phospholipase/carboxylesterase